jgi:hypothetical protein
MRGLNSFFHPIPQDDDLLLITENLHGLCQVHQLFLNVKIMLNSDNIPYNNIPDRNCGKQLKTKQYLSVQERYGD